MGFVVFDRKILEHWIFTEKPFDDFHAWAWLILNANYKTRERDLKQGVMEIQRGQLVVGIRYLADEWGWSKDRVGRYIKKLENAGMVKKTATQSGTVLTIENYAKYQNVRDTNKDGTKDGPKDGVEDNKNKDNNINKREGARARARGAYGQLSLSDSDLADFLAAYPKDGERYVQELDAYMAETGKKYKNNVAALMRWAKRDLEYRARHGEAPRQDKPGNAPAPSEPTYAMEVYEDGHEYCVGEFTRAAFMDHPRNPKHLTPEAWRRQFMKARRG